MTQKKPVVVSLVIIGSADELVDIVKTLPTDYTRQLLDLQDAKHLLQTALACYIIPTSDGANGPSISIIKRFMTVTLQVMTAMLAKFIREDKALIITCIETRPYLPQLISEAAVYQKN